MASATSLAGNSPNSNGSRILLPVLRVPAGVQGLGAYDWARKTMQRDLPVRVAAFVGRERERAKVADL
ncbi:MAG: hypothetical protein Q8Q52_07290, partial [Acidimicrobiia bacterium]|nr:hypothetical protein [Acidimicrobiia bacterium]